jgi:uncharacterized protein YkwD
MKNTKLRNVLLVAAIIILSLSSLPISANAASVAKDGTSEYKAEVIRLVNIEREKAGVKPIAFLDELNEPADVRARETKILFSHTRPGGTEWHTVFNNYSLEYEKSGENLAYGFKKPEALIKAWMGSDSHKKNILNPDYEYIGIGYYKDVKDKIYVSQLFYKPLRKIEK